MPTYGPPPAQPQAATAGYGAAYSPTMVGRGAGAAYAPTTVAYDATPTGDGAGNPNDPYNPVYRDFNQYMADNPNMAPMMGTSWEATPEQIAADERQRGQTGQDSAGWYSDKRNFQYGRNPYQATADVERARAQGAGAAQQGYAQGAAAQQYAYDREFDQTLTAKDAGAYGRTAAEGVAAAGQNVNQVGQAGGTGLQRLGATQGMVGQGLYNTLDQQGRTNQQAVTKQGTGLASDINHIGQAAAMSTSPATNSLTDLSGRGVATGETRGRELSAVGQSYGNRLSSLEQTEGPSGAQGMLNQQNNRVMNTQLALARSGRGAGGSAAAIQQAGQNIGALQQDAGNQAAQLRAQEYAAWRGRQAQNLNAAAGADIGARQAGAAIEQQAYGQGASATQAAGNLNLAGVQTQLQGATQAAGIAQQGALAGANLAQQNTQAGANAMQTGLGQAAQTYGQGVGYQMQGAEAAAASQAQAAAIGQGAYGQELGGLNAAAAQGIQGYGMAIDATNQGVANQLAFENQGYGVRQQEMQGGLALEDKYTRDYAIAKGAQQAENAARAQERAGYLQAGASFVGSIF